MKRSLRHRLRALTASVGLGLSCLGMARTESEVKAVGPFELVTERHEKRTQWFNPNGPMVERRVSVDERYLLRHRGKTLELVDHDPRSGVPSRYRHVQLAWILPAAEPALLVLVGNDWLSTWMLVRDRDGQALIETIARDAPLSATGIWLDAEVPGRNTQPYAKPLLPVRAGHISGGRWLLLGTAVVFDAVALRRHVLGDHRTLSFQRQSVLGMSPERDALARHAQRRETDESVIVVDALTDDRSTVMPIDRRRMRFREPEKLDAAWLSHHFRWQGTTLVEREDFRPLPYAGLRLNSDVDNGEAAEYRLESVDAAIGELVGDVLTKRFGARFQAAPRPYMTGYAQEPPYGRYDIDGHVLVLDHRSWDGIQASHMSLWPDGCCRNGAGDLWHRIADALDLELASGRHDALFDADHSDRDGTGPGDR